MRNLDTLAARLKAARVAANLSQPELAKRVGISQPVIADLENGISLGTKYIVQIALALRVEPVWLALNQGPRDLDTLSSARLKLNPEEQQRVLDFIEGMLRGRGAA